MLFCIRPVLDDNVIFRGIKNAKIRIQWNAEGVNCEALHIFEGSHEKGFTQVMKCGCNMKKIIIKYEL